jgi:hypothetical protein
VRVVAVTVTSPIVGVEKLGADIDAGATAEIDKFEIEGATLSTRDGFV